MSERTWTVDEANAALVRITELVERARRAARRLAGPEPSGNGASSNGHGTHPAPEDELADVLVALDTDGIQLRDVERGLVDFPARSPSGRAYWLCWVVGEPAVEWWHWPEDGFAGRTSITSPPA